VDATNAEQGATMGTLETLAVVLVIYVTVFVAHRLA
jgi:hypothetical protein